MNIPNAIESILFHNAEPIDVHQLAFLLKENEETIRIALQALTEQLSTRGIRVIIHDNTFSLGTAPETSALIEQMRKEELSRELSKSALETLAIILYKGPVTRAEIDYIRGVNSTFILRNLMVRGLVEKIDNPDDQRSFLYKSTLELLRFMGVTAINELPQYKEILEKLSEFSATQKTEDTESKETTRKNEEEFFESHQEISTENTDENEANIVEADLVGENFVFDKDTPTVNTHSEHP